MNHLVPAKLIVGESAQTQSYVEAFLQKNFCTQVHDDGVGCFCFSCRKIKNRQHHSIVWISPEKDYTVDDVDIIFDRIRFSLDPDQRFFFVLDNVQTLNTAAANRLLKVLEEPPRGYHFVLLTTNIESLLPTIVSRCYVTELAHIKSSHQSVQQHPLLAYFFDPAKRHDPFGFEAVLKEQALNDTQSIDLVNLMMASVVDRMRTELEERRAYSTCVLNFLMQELKHPPQSGSADLFWKNLFLHFPENQ
jgi:hypothetical protein